MKALVWHGARDLRYEDVDEPAPPLPGEAVVEVAACGVCGTDLHEYASGPHLIRPGAHPLTGKAPPFALGHELAGRVLALGGEVPGIAVGDRVCVDPCWRCGECWWCRRGEYHLCPSGGAVGLASPGGFATAVTVPLAGLVPLPDAISDRVGAVVEPLAVGLHAAHRGGVGMGDAVLVHGAGPIGIAALLAVRAAGAATVFVSDPLPERRERALRLGATEAYDPATDDVRREVFVRTGRVGPDVVIEATGRPELVASALETVRRGGHVVVAGVGSGSVSFDPTRLTFYERSLVGSLGYNFDLPRVVALLAADRIDAAELVAEVRPLADGVEVFAELCAEPGRHLKVLLEPEAA
ncbi:MAG: adh [Acidimicrobiaceae bacterium]|nr:adh [Acidimicrobiaceae bacterium]